MALAHLRGPIASMPMTCSVGNGSPSWPLMAAAIAFLTSAPVVAKGNVFGTGGRSLRWATCSEQVAGRCDGQRVQNRWQIAGAYKGSKLPRFVSVMLPSASISTSLYPTWAKTTPSPGAVMMPS